MLGITYKRLSTDKQRYGVEAQEIELEAFCKSNGIEVLYRFTDIGSGKDTDRPQLQKALAIAKGLGVKLIVSKLDRLTRNLKDLQEILSSGIEIVVVQFGLECPSILLNLMGSISQYERELISRRTKEALAAAKARGVKLGDPLVREKQQLAVKANLKRGLASAMKFKDIISLLRGQGLSYEATANKMNDMGLRTTRGCLFKANSVRRLAVRLTRQ